MEENESDPICPNCYQSICATNFASHSAFCERNIKICKMCNEPVRIANEKEHLEESHVTITCDDCGLPLEKWMLIKHQEICSKRLVTCDFCEADFRFDEYSSHLEFCSSKTERCMLCKKYVMLKDKQKHSELHLLQKKLANDEEKQNIVNEAISLQGISESCNKNEKNENRNQSSLSSARVMTSQSDAYTNSQSFTEAGALASSNLKEVSKHYGQCPICKDTIPWIDMNIHIPNCADEAGKCSRCGEVVPNSDIKEHTLRTCKKIGSQTNSRYEFNCDTSSPSSLPPQDTKDDMHECPYCRQPCSNDRISEHVKNCSDNYFECHMCGENVSEKNRDIHGSLQCRVLLDYGPESFYDCNASSNAAENKSKNSERHSTKKNKYPVSKPHIVSCSFCHEEFDADLEEIHLKYCEKLNKKSNTDVKSYAGATKSNLKNTPFSSYTKEQKENSERQKQNENPVIQPHILNCCFCHEEYPADLEEIHLKYCPELNKKIDTEDKSYAGATKLNLSNTPFSSYTKEQKEVSSKYCSCIKCNDTIRKERMQDHLLVCKSNRKTPCAYCDKAISVAEEGFHLDVCKGLIAFQNSNQVLENKNDYKGVIPKNSKFAQMAKAPTMKCVHCHVTFNADILLYHEEECVHKTVPCDKCCTPVKMIDLEKHDCKKQKGRKGNRGSKMNKDEKSETATSFGAKFKNFLGLNSTVKQIDKSDEARNQPYPLKSYIDDTESVIPYLNPYSYLDRSPYSSYSNNYVDNKFNDSFQTEDPSIPCEFCGELFSASMIILHSTGCDPESVKYRKPAVSEDTKENKSHSNKTESSYFPDTGVPKFFSAERKDRNFSSTGLENRKHTDLTEHGEFLQNTCNRNIPSEFLPTKPDIVKESENLSNRSKFQSVWNTDSNEIDNEALEILPRDSPPKEMTLDNVEDEIRVSDVTETMLVNNLDEPDIEVSDMLNFIMNDDDTTDASGENSSDSAEDGYLQPEKLNSNLEKNEVPFVASKQYEKVYELLNESKNFKVNKNEEEYHLTHASDCSARQKYFDKNFEMAHNHLQEINKDCSQKHHQTDRKNENRKDDVSKWLKWRNSSSDC